ncbi:transcription factor FAMA [Solanum pennellii]|uniref:Transcription factor FAMA n=1 Tax=Solanum pennellii TaxID=28526 RepID=A0ABM1VHS7_SOLPN|nr:transcription factor FAMA [Solanum pennellii]XP_027775295.1 transcription factor FAMA [Solanum pennellii]
MEKKEKKTGIYIYIFTHKHLYFSYVLFDPMLFIFTMLSHFEHEILLQPTIFPSLLNDDNYNYSLDDDSYNYEHQQMVNIDEEKALMVSQKEEEINVTFVGENSKGNESKKKRKRTKIRMKSSEEVENQRMTHIEVERNRRKQMNEHLHVLRSLMPSSYVQRGDQASIVGGAIEFVRELEQLLQCLESQKRRKLYGDNHQDSSLLMEIQNPSNNLVYAPNNNEIGIIQEDIAEIKSCLADVEVKIIGIDNAMIKILSKRRPGQLINTISALQDLQLNIIHTNVTTIEQTVLYTFNVKICGETRFSADNIANLVQQIFSFFSCK